MNRLFLSALGVMALVMLPSCGSDDSEPARIVSGTMPVMVTKTVSGTTGEAYDAPCSLALSINYTNRVVDGAVMGVRFSPAQPVTIDLPFLDCPATFANDKRFTFSGSGFLVLNDYNVDDLKGSVSLEPSTAIMSYTVSTPRSVSRVYTYSEMLYGALPGGATNYSTTTDTYYKFRYALDAEGKVLADIYIYNIRFAEGMPKLAEIRIPLADANVVSTTTGYRAEGTGIVPYYTQGGTQVPMDTRPIDNLRLDVDVDSKAFRVEFDCYGLHVGESGDLF